MVHSSRTISGLKDVKKPVTFSTESASSYEEGPLDIFLVNIHTCPETIKTNFYPNFPLEQIP